MYGTTSTRRANPSYPEGDQVLPSNPVSQAAGLELDSRLEGALNRFGLSGDFGGLQTGVKQALLKALEDFAPGYEAASIEEIVDLDMLTTIAATGTRPAFEALCTLIEFGVVDPNSNFGPDAGNLLHLVMREEGPPHWSQPMSVSERLMALLERGADVNATDAEGVTALDCMMRREDAKDALAAFLLKPDLEAGMAPALRDNCTGAVVKLLVEYGERKTTELKAALERESATGILQPRIDLPTPLSEIVDPNGRNALFYARDYKAVRLLGAAGVDPNAQDKSGTTPLHMVAQSQSIRMWETVRPTSLIRELHRAGARDNKRDAEGKFAFHYVIDAWQGTPQLGWLRDLLEAMTFCDEWLQKTFDNQLTLLHYAAREPRILKWLVRNYRDRIPWILDMGLLGEGVRGWRALGLRLACQACDAIAIEAMLRTRWEGPIDFVNARNEVGSTALFDAVSATMENFSGIVQPLLSAGAVVAIQDCEGRTPLHLARSATTLQALISVLRASPGPASAVLDCVNAKDLHGRTAMDFALQRNSWEHVAVLRQAGATLSEDNKREIRRLEQEHEESLAQIPRIPEENS